MAQGKKAAAPLVKAGVRQHEENMHKGKKPTKLKLVSGGKKK